jgi:hypothetical protein
VEGKTMTRSIFAQSVARRTVLAGIGAGVVGSLLRPLQAAETDGPPSRLLIIHRPCGTVLAKAADAPVFFFPDGGSARDFTLSPILQSLEPHKQDLVILDEVTCPRDMLWPADQHAAGLITMMCGKKFVQIPGTDANGDPNAKNIVAPVKTIEQHLLSTLPRFQGTRFPSNEATAYQPSEAGLPSFRVMSYDGNNSARFPESNPQDLFARIFTDPNEGLSPEQIARKLEQGKSVMDRVHEDLTRLQGLVPASQKPKLESHLAGIAELEKQLMVGGGGPTAAMCTKPTPAQPGQAINGATEEEATHLVRAQNQLNIIQTAFQCDLTRVATFTFAHGNSELRFPKIDPMVVKANGHHSTSHDTGAGPDQARIDQIYVEQLSALLTKLKSVPEGNGTLLDNTLVVFINECAHGNEHTIERMPVLFAGGKNLGLQGGQYLKYGGRYMNDVWAAMCGALGAPAVFGDPAFANSPVTGLFA